MSAVLAGLLGVFSLVIGQSDGFTAMLFVVAASIALLGFSVVRRTAGMAGLAETPFHAIAFGPDDLLASGSRVSLRLPDGRWVVARMAPPYRLLLAGVRRGWILGPDSAGRAFLQLPGSYRLLPMRVRTEPAEGSQPLAPVVREPLPPGRDPVLIARQKMAAGNLAKMAALSLIIAGFAGWALAGADDPPPPHWYLTHTYFSALAVLLVAVTAAVVVRALITIVRTLRPFPPDATWLELTLCHLEPYQLRGASTRMSGHAVLPDGRVVAFRAAGIDGSLAVNLAATGQLWAITPVRFGKRVQIGLPGYPILGSVTFSQP